MAVTYTATLKNTRLDAVTTAIGASGKLVIGTSALAGATGVLATIPLAATAAPAASGGVLTFTMPQSDTSADASGTAAKAEFRTAADAVVVSGLTVGTSGTDIVLGSTTITAGNTVTISSATITHG